MLPQLLNLSFCSDVLNKTSFLLTPNLQSYGKKPFEKYFKSEIL
jgi:hypothetical protein